MPMDTELIRFRIDPEIRDKAEEVCSALGHELHDVLRAAVIRIARDGALPFDLGAGPAAPAAGAIPFYHYDERRWGSMKPQIDAEVALALLARFIADCSTRLDQAGGAANAALNARVLGAAVSFLSVVGDDVAGQSLLHRLRDQGVDPAHVLIQPGRRSLTTPRISCA